MWKIPQGEYLYLKYLNGEIRPCGDHNLMGSYSIQKDPNFFFFPKRDLKWLFPSLQDTSGSEEPCDGLVPLSWRVTVWICCRWGPDTTLPWWCSHASRALFSPCTFLAWTHLVWSVPQTVIMGMPSDATLLFCSCGRAQTGLEVQVEISRSPPSPAVSY